MYLTNKAVGTSYATDTSNNVQIDKTKSSIAYTTGTGGNRLLSWKAHFDRPYQTSDSTDSVLNLGESVTLTGIMGSYKGTVKQNEVSYTATITVPSFAKLIGASISFVAALSLFTLAILF